MHGHAHGDHGHSYAEHGGEVPPVERPLALAGRLHARQLSQAGRRYLRDRLDFLHEIAIRDLVLPPRRPPQTDHVPVFLHVLAARESAPVFDSGDIEELTGVFEHVFAAAGDYGYFCRHHPVMTGVVHVVPGGPALVTVIIDDGPPMGFVPDEVTVGVGGTVRWENQSMFHHTVTSQEGASMATHCINGRGFVGNTPTIVAPSGQRLRFYVFNLDTSLNWHNFHPHGVRWHFAGDAIDIRSIGPAESFVVDAQVPPVLILEDDVREIQDPGKRPPDAKRYTLRDDFVFHCHVHHHMTNEMIGLVSAKQTVWLTDAMADHIRHEHGLAIDDGTNTCPDVDPHPVPISGSATGRRWQAIPRSR